MEYDIVPSPVYQVPVLYFRLHDVTLDPESPTDTVFRYLVPRDYHHELRSIGVISGISMTVQTIHIFRLVIKTDG